VSSYPLVTKIYVSEKLHKKTLVKYLNNI